MAEVETLVRARAGRAQDPGARGAIRMARIMPLARARGTGPKKRKKILPNSLKSYALSGVSLTNTPWKFQIAGGRARVRGTGPKTPEKILLNSLKSYALSGVSLTNTPWKFQIAGG
ncbi:hypothetical protein [Ruegeria sp.]|uniref:hypothetical protein n=1 Tax=Ruegeria sp. TaxID=1879320 RepID=UPI003B593C60